MTRSQRERFERWRNAELSWHPESGGLRGPVTYEDDVVDDLGPDADGSRFEAVMAKMLRGDHYPADAVTFLGEFRDEGRDLVVGDRVLQRARVLPFWDGLVVWSMVEIFMVEREGETFRLGYVTTRRHHARGIWRAELRREDGRLNLHVRLTACPQSVWFWVGLPWARWLQVRARLRAAEEHRKLCIKLVNES